MPDARQLSDLMSDIYDAALNPALWVGVLGKCAQFVGGPAASLVLKYTASKTGQLVFQAGLDEHYVQLYFDKYIKLDPNTTGQLLADVEQPVAVGDFMPYDEFIETRFYKEWSQPQGLVDAVSSVLEKSATGGALVLVFRHKSNGLVDDEARRCMRLIVPHIRRAVLIGKVIDLRTAEAATFTDTLDGISAGMFLVDGQGRIVHANTNGHALLADGSVLYEAGRKLGAHDPSAEHALHNAFLAAANRDTAGSRGIAVPLMGRDREHYVAHVLPLTAGARRRAAANCSAVAAVFVHEAALKAPSTPEVIAKAYELTATELRVLLAIVEVGGVPEVAEALGIAETTVKTHLGRLFQKTGAARQADLVKLLAAFANPLRS
jgi:DNA-binding CsgD family transcriptional regulator